MSIDCPKCGHEHQPSGSHEDDSGETECDKCGFKFHVEIEYYPSYYTSCIEHKYGEWEIRNAHGEEIEAQFCVYCNACNIKRNSV